MKLSDFDYILPKELIAQYPLKERDKARLLILNRAKASIEHCVFNQITDYFSKDDLLILNDTKVLPARLIGRRKTRGKVEILLVAEKRYGVFNALIKPAKLKINEEIIFDHGGLIGKIISRNEITFLGKSAEAIYSHGEIPLPPYIKRDAFELDREYYQTVYAKTAGAIASPTAGLHFTDGLIKKIEEKGVKLAYLTLHVGLATFKPVKVEDITKHKMEEEYFFIPPSTINLVKETKLKNKQVIAVGTTSARSLESCAQGKNKGQTNLFIYPGYKFQLVDSLLTNFHLPRTTLFMLVCAFAGEKLIKEAYQQAVSKKYRFYSYGDAMLII